MTFETKRFIGTIARGEQIFPIEFDVSADEIGRLSIKPLPLDTQAVFKLQAAMGEPGSYSESLVLTGTEKDGATFFSDTAELRGIRYGAHENTIYLEARKAVVAITIKEAVEAPFMRLWFRGFQSFRNPLVTMSLGQVQVGGPSTVASKDEMAGYVAVQAPVNVAVADWLKQADEFLTFMHLGLSFGHGGRLQTPRLDVLVGDRWEATFYDGDGFQRSLSPIHYLNQGPFITALAKRFDDSKPFPVMLWTAVGWLHNDNSFDEGRFLMSMTALETAVEHVISKSLTSVIPKAEFSPVRDRLLEALAECGLTKIPADIFAGKIKGLNGLTLSQKIQALRDHYHLPKDVFADEAIVAMIKARNDIVHTGASAKSSELWPKEMFVRELIARIVFHEIGYDGPYESYLNGYCVVHPETA